MIPIPQSTARVVMLKLFLTGTITPATGKTLAITISKAGAAFANPNAGATNATEVSGGWYKFTADTTDTNTLGDLVISGAASGCDNSERIFGVVKATTGGLTALPDTAVATNASLITSGTGTSQVNPSGGKVSATIAAGDIATDAVDANALKSDAVTEIQNGLSTLTQANVRAAVGMNSANMDTQLATIAGYIDTEIATLIASVGSSLNALVTAVKAKTDNLPAAPAAVADIPSAVANAAAVWDLPTSGHTTSGTFGAAMNAAGSAGDPWATTLPGSYASGTAGHTVGNNLNAAVAAVKAKTDNLPTSPAAVGSAMTLADGAITDAKITFPAEASGRPTTFLAAMRRLWEWTCNKRIRTRSTGALALRNAADSATLETQTQSTAGGTGSEIDTQTKGV